jgi:voltage-gated potassium channel
LWGRVRFATTPLAIVDLVAVLPFYLPFVGVNMLFVRAIRLVRVFRIAKLARYSTALRTFGRVLSQKKEELIIASFLLGLSAVITSTLMYFAESDAQPQYFSSIPAAMWWIVWFMVGKGDVFPVTIIGKCVGVAIAILGVAIFALPTAILGAGFLEEMQHRHKHENICPHCGKELTK